MFSKTVGKWLDATGADADVVLSSRVRLARNMAGVPFPNRASPAQQDEIVSRVETALRKLSVYAPDRFAGYRDLTPLNLQYLVERHLVSRDFALPGRRKAVFISPDERLSVMVNEEDHLRLQMLASGFDPAPAMTELASLDTALGSELDYAFSEQLGFLTACPTNVGTALRASVLIHLPGLSYSDELEKILRGALQVGLTVRGLFGEGSEARGHLFQISNQVTLGKSETEIIQELVQITQDIISLERRARSQLMQQGRNEIEDKVFRSEAILNSARLLTGNEATNLLGMVRLGVATGLLPRPDMRAINELLIITRPANLQVYYNQELTQAERDARRAELVRARMRAA